MQPGFILRRILGKVWKSWKKCWEKWDDSLWTRKMFGVMYLQGGPPADRYTWGEITCVNVLPEPCAFFLGGGLKNPALHCNDVYIYICFFVAQEGRGCENLRSEDPFKADVLEFWRVFVHRGSEAKGRVVCFQKMFPKKNQRTWPFDLFFGWWKTWPFQCLLVTSN